MNSQEGSLHSSPQEAVEIKAKLEDFYSVVSKSPKKIRINIEKNSRKTSSKASHRSKSPTKSTIPKSPNKSTIPKSPSKSRKALSRYEEKSDKSSKKSLPSKALVIQNCNTKLTNVRNSTLMKKRTQIEQSQKTEGNQKNSDSSIIEDSPKIIVDDMSSLSAGDNDIKNTDKKTPTKIKKTANQNTSIKSSGQKKNRRKDLNYDSKQNDFYVEYPKASPKKTKRSSIVEKSPQRKNLSPDVVMVKNKNKEVVSDNKKLPWLGVIEEQWELPRDVMKSKERSNASPSKQSKKK